MTHLTDLIANIPPLGSTSANCRPPRIAVRVCVRENDSAGALLYDQSKWYTVFLPRLLHASYTPLTRPLHASLCL